MIRSIKILVICSVLIDIKIQDKQDWFKVSKRAIVARGGKRILECYDGSLYFALKAIYPEYPWVS